MLNWYLQGGKESDVVVSSRIRFARNLSNFPFMTKLDKTAKQKIEEQIKELTLLLLYLNSWVEKEPYGEFRRAWKGYDFDILNELTDEGLVNARNRSKSASFTDEGAATALELLTQYGITLEQQGGEESGIDGTK